MASPLISYLQHSWNAFRGRDHPKKSEAQYAVSTTTDPDIVKLRYNNARTILASVYNRIALDCAAIPIKHVLLDDNGYYIDDVDSKLNECLTVSPNSDQIPQSFIQNLVLNMCDSPNGFAAIIPTETDKDPSSSGSWDIQSMRIAEVREWKPDRVLVYFYDEYRGYKREAWIKKEHCAIFENPFRSIMNEANTTAARLARKLAISDVIDNDRASHKLNIIIQVPYGVSNDRMLERAKKRIEDFEVQIENSPRGIAYADATEKIIQLNRPLEDSINEEIDKLTGLLYSQLGITEEIMNGSASEMQMSNYMANIIEPIMTRIVSEMRRKFLTKNARSRGQTIDYFRNYFKLGTLQSITQTALMMKQQEVLVANEVRAIFGLKPNEDERSNMPINSNVNPIWNTEDQAETGEDGGFQAQDQNQQYNTNEVDQNEQQ